jgi:hypothetical protein
VSGVQRARLLWILPPFSSIHCDSFPWMTLSLINSFEFMMMGAIDIVHSIFDGSVDCGRRCERNEGREVMGVGNQRIKVFRWNISYLYL